MKKLHKKTWFYFLVILSCIGAYFLSKSSISKKLVEKKVVYVSDTASEIYMVWGIMDGTLPAEKIWPTGSYINEDMIWTKMENIRNEFITTISLPPGSHIYYLMVQTRNKTGQITEIWDGGGYDKKYFTDSISYNGFINPGYFIFLAGFLPLVLFYINNRNNPIHISREAPITLKNYIPQLDSIRAIAVLLVIIHHWLPEKSILNFFNNGRLGVNIFFVLSGFLITGILLKSKKKVEENKLKKGKAFQNFYIRRTLRIFPIYYLLLLIFWFLKDPAIKEDGIYYFTYTSNYLFYSQEFFPARVAHLWSLGVEEQFYLIWPWLIVLTNKKILPYLIALFLTIGISSNYIFTGKGWWVEIFTPSCLDAFATGGFLSWLIAYRQDLIMKIQPIYKFIFIGVIILFVSDVFNLSFLPARTIHSFLAIVIIYYCLFKNNNIVANYILNNKWLIRLGKISYGIYLYHLFIPELWQNILNKFSSWDIDLFFNNHIPASLSGTWLFFQELLLLLLIASLSWRLIEKPINKLKERFV